MALEEAKGQSYQLSEAKAIILGVRVSGIIPWFLSWSHTTLPPGLKPNGKLVQGTLENVVCRG